MDKYDNGVTLGFNGAAACEPRRRPCINPAKNVQVASMGPRLVSRGDIYRLRHSTTLRSFNGAAACEPRRPHAVWDMGCGYLSFNGAAACEPRRHSKILTAKTITLSFNGAAACEPRRLEKTFPYFES